MTNPDVSEADVDDSTQTKACKKCGKVQALAGFYIRQGKHQATCKRCIVEQNTAWAKANRQAGRDANKRWRAANPEKVAERNRSFYQANKAANKERVEEWRRANPEAVKRTQARFRAQPGRAQLAMQRAQSWREANPDKVADWLQRHPEKHRVTRSKRRAAKLAATVGEIDYEALWTSSGGVCEICAEPLDRSVAWPDPLSASMDHIVPLSRGAEHSQRNLRMTHLVCNLRKGDRLVARRALVGDSEGDEQQPQDADSDGQ